jgi:hypothetical protein
MKPVLGSPRAKDSQVSVLIMEPKRWPCLDPLCSVSASLLESFLPPILGLQCAYLMQILAAESLLNMALEWHRLTMVGRRWKPQM